MILSEFVLTKVKGSRPLDLEYFADVTVTTGRWWWKKSIRKTIHREYAQLWHFVDTGEFTPGNQAETLERAYNAKNSFSSAKEIA